MAEDKKKNKSKLTKAKKEAKKVPVNTEEVQDSGVEPTMETQIEGVTKFTFGKEADKEQEDVPFMAPVTGAFRTKPKSSSHLILYSLLSILLIAIVWSYFAQLDQITRAQGVIIPSGQTKVIDHLEGGIVKEIKVREGDIVDKGQVLLVVDATVAKEKYYESMQLYYRTKAQIARLKALTSNQPFVMPEDVQKNAPDIAAKEMTLYHENVNKLKTDRQIAEQELEQKKQEALQAKARVQQLEEKLALSDKEAKLMEPLVKSGVAPQMEWLRLQREITDNKGDLATARVMVPKTESAILGAQKKLDAVEINILADENKELREAQLRWAEIKDNTVKNLDQLQRTEIRSPVRGTIKELKINTIGGVIQPGKDLIAITPLEDQLLVEAQVQPSDVAFLRPGMRAMIKITAYDYGIYGGLEATLLDISADTLVDEKTRDQKQYFRIRLKTDRNYLGTPDKRLPISPGMACQVDILTGKRTVMQYILKPFLKAKENALTER